MVFNTKVAQTDLSCSVTNLINTSLPVIFSILSGTLMHIFDRIMLSHYSLDAMNGAALASQVSDIFLLPLLSFATISEVFVGQLNGLKHFKKASDPIIQITTFLIIIWFLIFPFTLYYHHFFIPQSLQKEGSPYFCIGMATIPFQIIFSALSAFFVGTRRPNIILPSVIIANILNVLLDFIFIFGIGIIPAMGAKGAAIASLIASIISSGMLIFFFTNRYNALNYDTRHLSIDYPILKKNIAIGAPYALSEFVEMTVWVFLILFLEKVSMDAVTIQNVAVILWIFFTFFADGLQKGVIALASNCIGAGKDILIKRLIRSMGIMTCFFALFSAFPLLIYAEQILYYIFGITEVRLFLTFRAVLFLLWISLILLLIVNSCLSGILSSGGDTKFITCVKTTSILTCVALPICIFFYYQELTVLTSWWLTLIQQLFNGTFFYIRYKGGKWKHNLIN